MPLRKIAFVTLTVILSSWSGAPAQQLEAGAAAPEFALTQMVRGAAVPKLDAGRVHLVEFWGTDAGMGFDRQRDYARLQKEHGDKLVVVGVVGPSEDYDFEGVADYYAEHGEHIDHRIGFDGEGKLHESWLAASGNDAPLVFLVDQKGRIAWIGGMGFLSIALPKVVAGDADAKALAEETEAAQQQFMRLALTAGLRPKSAIEELDKLVERWPSLESLAVVTAYGGLVGSDEPELALPLQARVCDALIADEDAMSLNGLAWSIVDPEVVADTRNLEVAERAARKAVELTEQRDTAILDTLARVFFWKKDYAQAVEWQKKAVALAEDEEERDALAAVLSEYEAMLDGK